MHCVPWTKLNTGTFFPFSQETALALQVLPDIVGCQRPAAWSQLFHHFHPKVPTKIFQYLGMYVIQFYLLSYFKKLSLSQTLCRGMVDGMNRKGFGRWGDLIADFVHINSRNHKKHRSQNVSAVIRSSNLPNITLPGFNLNKIDPLFRLIHKFAKETIRSSFMSVGKHEHLGSH